MRKGKLGGDFARERKNIIFGKGCLGILLASLGTVTLGTVFLSSGAVSAATSTAKNDISVKVSGYCSVSNENHTYNKEIGTGSFSEIGSGNVFDIYCNDEEGYVVYAVGNGKDISSGDGANKEGVTDLIGSNTNNVIHTGINQSGNESGWSFKLSNATSGMVIEDGFSNNSLIPSTRTKIVSRPAGTAAATGDNFTATYSAYISTSQEPDTYTGGVKYILFHPSTTVFYEINYNLNSGSWTGTSPETGTEAGGYVNISSIAPTKDGYDFKGWCNVPVSNNNSSTPTCSGQTYQPGNGVELPNSNNIINLYAIWQKKEPTMQNFTCNLVSGTTTTIKDTRDGTTYKIAKLADGKCWMTENLKIQNRTLTTADSDVAGDFVLPSSTDRPNAGNAYDSKELHVDNTYGGYYTWYTATAGEGTQNVSTNDQNVSHSICPKGWRLPTKDEFVALDKAFGGTGRNSQGSSNSVGGGKTLLQMYQDPPASFKMGGRYRSGSAVAYTVGSQAYYWSSTTGRGIDAYSLYFNSGSVNPQYNLIKDCLASVRCVSRE